MAGFVVGVAGAVQAVTIQVGRISVPIGLVGTLAATGLVFFAGAWLDHRPIGVLLPALAWLLGVFPFTIKRPEGDLVLSGDLQSYGLSPARRGARRARHDVPRPTSSPRRQGATLLPSRRTLCR